MTFFDFIIWSFIPEIFHNVSWLPVRWYGLLFAIAFITGQQIYYYFYKTEQRSDQDVETLTIYLVLGTIIGARLGHVLFYEPDKFLANPLEILKIWKGGLASHGAAVGILLSVYIFSNYLVKINFKEFIVRKIKREGQGFLYIMDRIVIVVALGGSFVRLGNFLNSEIIGKPTGSDRGIVFARDVIDVLEYVPTNPATGRLMYPQKIEKTSIVHSENSSGTASVKYPVDILIEFKKEINSEGEINAFLSGHVKQVLANSVSAYMHIHEPANLPLDYSLAKNERGKYVARIHTSAILRHPAQLYESISCLLLFFLLFFIWKKGWKTLADGRIFGIFLIILFTLRFIYEPG